MFPTSGAAAQNRRVQSQPGFDWTRVEYLILYFNNISSNASVSVQIAALKAIPKARVAAAVETPAVTVNGTQIKIPITLERGKCVTINGRGRCTLWPGGMKPGESIALSPATFTLQPGANRVELTCANAEEYGGDVAVRVSRLWPMEM